MNRSMYLIIGVIVVAALLAWMWYTPTASEQVGNTASTSAPVATPDIDTPTPTKVPTKLATTNTFKSIFAQQGSHECIYQQVTPNSQSKNVIQIADGKMRGEFRTVSGTDTSNTIMVYSGGDLYVWTEGSATGKKTTIKSVADLPAIFPKDLASDAVLGTNTNSIGWDCHTWLKDPTKLVAPSYVRF